MIDHYSKSKIIRMRTVFFIALVLVSFCSIGQIKSTHTYAVKDGDSLKLDVYQPESSSDVSEYPAVIWMHGGGFSGGQRDNGDEVKLMEYLASNGYVGISISYRLLRKGQKTGFGCECPKDEKLKIFEQAANDYLDAAKFIFENHSRFNINKNQMIAGGSSAGAEAVLSAVYMKDYYIKNSKDYKDMEFSGLISLAGALANSNYITKENAIPTVMFHGTADNAVPFGTAPHHYCDPGQAGYLMLDGSETIANRLKKLNTSYYFHVEIDGHHGLSSIPFDSLDTIFEFFDRTMNGSTVVQSKIIVEADKN